MSTRRGLGYPSKESFRSIQLGTFCPITRTRATEQLGPPHAALLANGTSRSTRLSRTESKLPQAMVQVGSSSLGDSAGPGSPVLKNPWTPEVEPKAQQRSKVGNFQFPSDQASQLDLTQDTRVKGWGRHFPRSSCAGGSPVGGSPKRSDWGGTPEVLLILHRGPLCTMPRAPR